MDDNNEGVLPNEELDTEIEGEPLESAEPEIEEEDISIGEPESPAGEDEQEATNPIRQLREANKAKERELKEARRLLQQLQSQQPQQPEQDPEVLPRKSLEDFDYDVEAFNGYQDKREASLIAANAAKAKREAAQTDAAKEHQGKVAKYQERASQLKVKPEAFKEAEQEVIDTLEVWQQNALLETDMPERLVYALGRNSDRLKKLSEIKNPMRFAIEVGALTKELVVTPKKREQPQAERSVRSSGTGAVKLDALYAKAQQSGDYTAYFDAKRAQNK